MSTFSTPTELYEFLTKLETPPQDLNEKNMGFPLLLSQIIENINCGEGFVFRKAPGYVYSMPWLVGQECVTLTRTSGGYREETRHVIKPGEFLVYDSEKDATEFPPTITNKQVRGLCWPVSAAKIPHLFVNPDTGEPPEYGCGGLKVEKKGWGLACRCDHMGYTHHVRPDSWGEGDPSELNDYIVINGALGETGAQEAYCIPESSIGESVLLEPFCPQSEPEIGFGRTNSC